MEGLRQAILEHAARAGARGIPMGQVVDALVGRGFAVQDVEHTIWGLLGERLLTPSGFVCRMLRRRDDLGELVQSRCYELMLTPWSREQDDQLDLALDQSEQP